MDAFKRGVERAFDRSAARYALQRESQPGFRRQAAWILSRAGPARGRRLLEVGAGSGSLLSSLREAGFAHAAVDLSAEMTARYADRARQLGAPLRVLRGDAERLPLLDASVDVVVAVGLLEYLPGPRPFLAEACRVLRDGGQLLLSVPSAVAPHALAAGLARRFSAGLPGSSRAGSVVRSRPLRLGALRRELCRAGLVPGEHRFSRFVFFPLDRLLPQVGERVAALLEPWGRLPVLCRLGAQILIDARRPPAGLDGQGGRAL